MNQTALITGASNGIGLEFAYLFAHKQYNLVLVARSEEKLNELAHELERKYGISATVIAQDLATDGADQLIMKQLDAKGIEVDILINNAGFGGFGEFANTNLENELNMIQVNITALTALTKRVLPGMMKRKRGRILNVASTAAFQPGPLMAVYYASKAYVLSFSEALANELKDHHITVTALCPGPTKTGFTEKANLEKSKLFKQMKVMDVKTVVEAGYSGMMKGKTVIIPGLQNKLLASSTRFAPRNVVTSIVRSIQERV
ncbi:SDR family oxidoreductase [Bacillus sp. FJAT-47783]|uniref:SDR family NAD(P)-dependent oxidoreductase n=1 Tax=Bacillus sp. FJAT-47783 TaxID=2922712 RepID=UPI001FAD7C28|nr:SDR family oxidoreductase [Bacillus sp. FJAT-47783]